MQSEEEKQQLILGYFLEEAREDLATIENGLLNIQSTLENSEMINEVFRAVYSIKSSSAMLGLTSIQRTAHRLEECLKILKEHPIQVDHKLEYLFLKVSNTLKTLIDYLSSNFDLPEDQANSLMAATEPVIEQLNQHLLESVKASGHTAVSDTKKADTIAPPVTPITPGITINQSQIKSEFETQVLQILREILQLFKQVNVPELREKLQHNCHQLTDNNEITSELDFSSLISKSVNDKEPEAGISELNTLADLFEGESTELEESWQQEEIFNTSDIQLPNQDLDAEVNDVDLADLLAFYQVKSPENSDDSEDVTQLFEDDFLPRNIAQSNNEQVTSISSDLESMDLIFPSDDVLVELIAISQKSRQNSGVHIAGSLADVLEIRSETEVDAVTSELLPIFPEDNNQLEVKLPNVETNLEYLEDLQTNISAQKSSGNASLPLDDLLANAQKNISLINNELDIDDIFAASEIPNNSDHAQVNLDSFWDEIATIQQFSVPSNTEVVQELEASLFSAADNLPNTEIDIFGNDSVDRNHLNISVENNFDLTLPQDSVLDLLGTENQQENSSLDELENNLFAELANFTNVGSYANQDFKLLPDFISLVDDGLAVSSPQSVGTAHSPSQSLINDEFDELENFLKQTDENISSETSPANKNVVSKITQTTTHRIADEETMKIPVKQLDDMSNSVGELVVNRNILEQDYERLRKSLNNLLIQVQNLSDVGARMQEYYERSLLESSLLASYRHREQKYNVHQDRGFSAIEMDKFTPFHSLAQEMIELIVGVQDSASDIDFVLEETEQVARQIRQATSQLQEGLTKARMVPFSQAIDLLWKGMPDNQYGKQVELVTEGTDTLIDKTILDHLKDPLTQMVNNAIAHGIETAEVRQSRGKPPVGKITIRALQQGNQTIIAVSDDGAGIDHEKVKQKGIKKGVITVEQARTMSRSDIYELLFLPSFSTADELDDIKVGGVGMNVVQKKISEIRGTITTDSVLGQGTTFTIRLPLTLSICKALLCTSDRARIAFPMDGIEDTLDIPAKNIKKNTDGQSFIKWRDTILPFKPLKDILVFNRQISRNSVYGCISDDDMISVIVVRSGNNMVALQIDQVLSEQEIVIKQFEGPVPKPIGVAGATVLRDGMIMPIADVLEIIDIFHGKMSKYIGGNY
ncbi:chemotaxis protein CheW [Anabaena sp. FACHB-1237]|nr:chemotaxis protein CheA [Anabaena sp. FACHB-1237]MBD2136402.1 chemotaxis protein CheW [Anabaena sp. FACHB-1237]